MKKATHSIRILDSTASTLAALQTLLRTDHDADIALRTCLDAVVQLVADTIEQRTVLTHDTLLAALSKQPHRYAALRQRRLP